MVGRIVLVRIVLAFAALTACGSTTDRDTPPPSTTSLAPTTTSPATTSAPTSTVPKATGPKVIAGPVGAFGDSLMIGAAPALRELISEIDIDAVVSRSALPVPSILRARRAEGRLPPSLVLDLALNGGVSPELLDEVFTIAAGRRVVMLTARCPYCTYTATENAIIRAECTKARNCRVADWEALGNANPEWFGTDGVHIGLGGRGAHAYAQLVRTQLTRRS